MVKIDVKDRALLYELSLDSRQPLSALSKKTGLSRDFVNYRISRLVKEKVIKQFIAEIEAEKLGFSRHTIYLQYSNVNKEKESEIIDYIAANSFVSWVVKSVGRWNLVFDIITKNNNHLYNVLENLKENFGQSISEYKLASLGKDCFFNEKYFGGLSETKKTKNPTAEFDETDFIILYFLSKNARMTNIEIAKELNISPETVRKRVKYLTESEIIKRFTIATDISKLGLELYNIQLIFEKYDKKREEQLFNHLKQHPKISFIYMPVSNWDLEFGLFAKNAYELNDELAKIRNLFSDFVKINDSILLAEEIVPNIIPEGTLKK